MNRKTLSKSSFVLITLLILGFLHAFSLWDTHANLAAGYGDPLAHSELGQYYCTNVLSGDFHTDRFLAPFGVDFSGSYDSPFPFILSCPALAGGPIFQFHIFTLIQIWLIILGAWLVATVFIQSPLRQFAYVLFVWWCGFYISRSHQHVTLLSVIWGAQFVFYAIMNLKPKHLGNVLGAGLLLGLSYTGTFQNLPGLFLITVVLAVYKIWQLRSEFKDVKVLRNIACGLLLALVVFAVLWGPMIAYTLKNGAVSVDDQRRLYNLDLLSPFIPPEFSRIFDWWPSLTKLPLERQNSFDFVVMILVLASLFTKKFWRDSFRRTILFVGIVYFILALGPELRINDQVSSYLDFNVEIFHYFPMRITRTTGRLAAITNMCFILMAFIYLENLSRERLKNFLTYGLIAWGVFAGPFMNQMWLFPTLKYTDILPANALTEVRNMPSDTIVVQIPSGWARDPAQNFLQIFHNKRITAGYLAYTNYNQKVMQEFAAEPFLGKLGCDGDPTAFAPTPLMTNSNDLRSYLLKQNYRVIIIDKTLLLNDPACKNLTTWVQQLVKQPWIKVLEEGKLYVVAVVQ